MTPLVVPTVSKRMVISKAAWIGALVSGLVLVSCLALAVSAGAAVLPDTIGLFRPDAPTGNNTFFLLNKNILAPPANTIAGYGNNGDIEVVGDWNGDGIVTIGVFRPDSPVAGTNTFFLRNTNSLGTGDITIESIGQTGDIPLVGDWDGNGTTTVGLFRPNVPPGLNTLLLWNSNTNPPGPPDIIIAGIGADGDRPVVGKWTGTGNASSIGLLRPNVPTDLNTFFIWNNLPLTPPYVPDFTIFGIGANGDRPLAGDWDGNGTVTIGLFRSGEPSDLNSFFLWNTIPLTPPYNPDVIVAGFGAAGLDHPVTGLWGNNPPVIAPAILQIAENSPNGTNVGAPLTFSDPDNPDAGQTLTLSITAGNTGTTFAIDPTGQITVANNALLDFETHPTFNLTVRVTDNGNPVFFGEAAVTVNLTNVVEAPVLSAGGTLNYTEGDLATAIDNTINVTPGDSANLQSATAQITGACSAGEDVLSFANTATITASGGGCNLTLTGSDTVANWITALRNVKYNNTSNAPSTAARTVTWQVNDGTSLSNTATSTINVASVNSVPQLTAGGGFTYTEGDLATAIDTTVNVTDADSANLQSATVQITGACSAGEDVLSFANTATITASGGGCNLTLTGSDTVANWITALRNVKYNNTSENPSGSARTVTWQVNDGTDNSNTATSTINVTPVNDAPTGVSDPPLHQVTGNVSITTPVGTLLTGATDVEGNTPLTAKHPTGGNAETATLNGGLVTVNADGSYVYNPPAGREGADSFTFQVCDVLGACSTPPNTVNLNVSGMIWFINNNALACSANCNGRLSNPFTSLSAFNGVNNGTGNNPAANDNIFVYEGATDYAGPLTLLSGQKLIGQDATNTISEITGITPPGDSAALPGVSSGNGTIVNITSASGNTVTLGSGNTLRGFTLGNNSAGAALAGTTFGTLTLANGTSQAADLKINNTTGQALNLNTGTIASVFHSITSSAGTNNILLTSVQTTGTTGLGSGALSGATAEALFITGQNGSFTYSGTITNTGGTRAVRIESKTGGTVTLSGNINPGVVGTARGILVQNNNTGTNTIDFTGSTKIINTGAGTGVDLVTNTGATISFTNGGLDIDTTSGIGFNATGTTGTTNVNVSGSNNTITTGTGTALNLNGTGASTIGGSIAFANVTTAGGGAGLVHIALGNVAAPVTIAAGSLLGAAAGVRSVDIGGGSANFTYSGTIATNGGGIRVINRTGTSTVLFDGTTKNLNTGTTNAVEFTGNSATSTLSFTNGGLDIDTTTGIGFNATSGIVNVTGANNSISSGTGIALNVSSSTIGASGLIFRSISANGAANGIVLNTTGNNNGLTVTGDGNTSVGGNTSGGTIQNTTSHGVSLNNTLSPSFTNMSIHDNTRSGINGTLVTNFTFANGTIDVVGTGGTADDANISFNDNLNNGSANVTGTVSITNSILNHARYHGVDIQQDTGTLSNVTISGNTFTSDSSITTSLGSAIRIIALGNTAATTVAHVTKATLANNTITNFNTGAGFVLQGGNAQDNAAAPSGTFGDPASATNLIAVTGNHMDGGTLGVSNQPDRFVTALVNGRGQGHFDISGNGTLATPIKNIDGVVIELSAFGQTTVKSHINNNFIASNNAVGAAGIGVGCSNDGLTTTTDNAVLSAYISGNTVSQNDGPDILTVANGDSTCTLNTTIANNTLAAPDTTTSARAGIRVDSGNSLSDTTVCLDITGNTTAGSTNTGTGSTSPGINLRRQTTGVNVFGIKGMAATATPGVENFVNAQNTSTSGTFGVGGTALLSGTTGFSNCATSPTN